MLVILKDISNIQSQIKDDRNSLSNRLKEMEGTCIVCNISCTCIDYNL